MSFEGTAARSQRHCAYEAGAPLNRFVMHPHRTDNAQHKISASSIDSLVMYVIYCNLFQCENLDKLHHDIENRVKEKLFADRDRRIARAKL